MSKIFLLLFFLVSQSYAEDAEFRFGYEAFLYGETNEDADSGILDQRAELKWLIKDAKIILRPRIVSVQSENDNETDLNLTDAFYEQYITDAIFSTVGLQVYQWGPAELLNPSNPFFHFNTDQRTLVYKEKGKMLLRLNWNLRQENNFVFIAEPVSNNEPYYIAEEKFKPQFAMKYEKSWTGTRNFFGLSAGIPDNADVFIGEYFQFEFIEGLSIYADAKHSLNSFFYEPQQQGFFQRMLPSNQDDQWATLAVTGLRYEDNFDARLEYVHNSIGYDKDTFNKALISFDQNRLQKSGLELLSQNYVYFSLRKSDPFELKDLSLFFRSITSLMDNSGVEQFEFDKSILDWLNIFGQYSAFRGEENSEFTLGNDWKASLGAKAIY